jgi:NIMA (never in mitosis gene a)-related kinase
MSARNNYVVLRPAVQGMGGTQNSGIYIVQHRHTGQKLIEKRIIPNQNGSRSLHAEIRAMQACRNHANIISIFESDTQDYTITYGSIWMQHCELGSLDKLIMRYEQRGAFLPDEGFMWKVFWDLSLALCYLWTGNPASDTRERAMAGRRVNHRVRGWKPMIHRDLKPANIFMTWDEPHNADGGYVYPTVKIGDFGCCIRGSDVAVGGMNMNPMLLTHSELAFDPPEPTYSEVGDLYACGLVLHCLGLMRQVPYGPVTRRARTPFGDGSGASQELRSRVQDCLMPNPNDRPSPQDLPMVVWEGHKTWRRGRRDHGQPLPSWALR